MLAASNELVEKNLVLLHVYLSLLDTFDGPTNCELSPGHEFLASDLNSLVDTHPSLCCVVWMEWLKQCHTAPHYALSGQKCICQDLDECQYSKTHLAECLVLYLIVISHN